MNTEYDVICSDKAYCGLRGWILWRHDSIRFSNIGRLKWRHDARVCSSDFNVMSHSMNSTLSNYPTNMTPLGYVTDTGRPGEGRPVVPRCSYLLPVVKRTVLMSRWTIRWFRYSQSPVLSTRRISSPHRFSDPPLSVTSGHSAYSTLRPSRLSVYWRLRYDRRYGY